ncbi:MAG: hypothetical protein HXN95_02945 [Prevotella salivae]|jgi:hypothetical protein|uniref:hypothetical protein n=1 Tax=Segatella salivae TaxID=228604 RepID=UPI001CB0EC59|nr:hypothetical protein [Segatella salivae]MBF1520973.1 hypothetical protein [Segatella salivae]
MIYLVFALVFLGLITALGSFLGRKKGEEEVPLIVNDSCSTCTGENDQCEQECMMEAATKEIEYYDDEELDRFRGRLSEDYTDEEAESFSEVMLTMRPDEVKGWNRSLILRGINMPNQIKDDFIALVND